MPLLGSELAHWGGGVVVIINTILRIHVIDRYWYCSFTTGSAAVQSEEESLQDFKLIITMKRKIYCRLYSDTAFPPHEFNSGPGQDINMLSRPD